MKASAKKWEASPGQSVLKGRIHALPEAARQANKRVLICKRIRLWKQRCQDASFLEKVSYPSKLGKLMKARLPDRLQAPMAPLANPALRMKLLHWDRKTGNNT